MRIKTPHRRLSSMLSTRLWMFVLVLVLICLLYTNRVYAQTSTGTDTQSPPTSTLDTGTPAPTEEANKPNTISFFGLQSQRFAQDVQRQITDFILPVTVGEYVLNTLHYQAITPRVKAHILFITAGFGNSAQMQMYQELSTVFVDAGYDTMIATLPVGEQLPTSLADASGYWAEALNGIINAVDNSSPYSVVYASGPIAATLLALYDEQRLPLPNALVIQDVFFAQHDENQKLPGLIERFPNALLDFSQTRANRWSNATVKTRQQTIQAQAVRQKTQRQLYGMPLTGKQRHLIYKEMTGWFKRIGWM